MGLGDAPVLYAPRPGDCAWAADRWYRLGEPLRGTLLAKPVELLRVCEGAEGGQGRTCSISLEWGL